MIHSSRKPAACKVSKPAKPRRIFHSLPTITGSGVRRFGKRMYYFGSWDDPDGALTEYEFKKIRCIQAEP